MDISTQAHCPLVLLLGNGHLEEGLFQGRSPKTRCAPGPGPTHPSKTPAP